MQNYQYVHGLKEVDVGYDIRLIQLYNHGMLPSTPSSNLNADVIKDSYHHMHEGNIHLHSSRHLGCISPSM